MKSIMELCKPRDDIFVDTAREDVQDLTDLAEGRIDGEKFFDETFRTDGMNALFSTAFARFQGKSDTGVIKLTQSMGGGKTHNMIALALLAKAPELRRKVLGPGYEDIGEVRVISFSGRETDVPFGIWEKLASQLGKREVFEDLYSPLRAPGQSSWINLLQGQKTLVLLDELPPYMANAKSIPVGDSNLCNVTVIALANLLRATVKSDLSNVLIVISDLNGTWTDGSDAIREAMSNLEHEISGVAISLEPVKLNSDEIYDILRTKLFKSVPAHHTSDVMEIALAYQSALDNANKAGLTNDTPHARYIGIMDSYPFHPSIKDLYARFKENPNFQQTRGLIRLMRMIIKQFYESGKAKEASLINAYDVDLNNSALVAFLSTIKSSLANAVSHDIAQGGMAAAEIIDDQRGCDFPYAKNISRLLYMASLNDTVHAVNGLTRQEIMGYLCEPGVDLAQYGKALDDIIEQSWYLKMDNRGRYYYQNTKNMIAQMNTLIQSYSNEKARNELIKTLGTIFTPTIRSCYEKLYIMPAVDEIKLENDKITLVIFEPCSSNGLHPDLIDFFNNAELKNRIMFLSGQKNMLDKLYENSKKKMAIEQLIKEMEAEHVAASDQQYVEAQALLERTNLSLYSTIVNTFVTLYYPTKNGLSHDEIKFQFDSNKLDGEKQVVDVLRENKKYEDLTSDDQALTIIRMKCETRCFTQKAMPWSTILDRAATEISFPWYHRDQMKKVLDDCLKKDIWRDIGGYITKGPFTKEPTEVQVDMKGYNYDTHEFTLNVRGLHGTTVYYDIGAAPSSASAKVENPFITKEPDLYFLCVDNSADPHPTGDPLHYHCAAPLKHEIRGTSNGNVMELMTHPSYEIRYTTDGSNPKDGGGLYDGEILLPDGCRIVRVAVFNHGELVEEKQLPVNATDTTVKIDANKQLEYTLKMEISCGDTQETYAELDKLSRIPNALIRRYSVTITSKEHTDEYLDLSAAKVPYSAADLKATIDLIRETAFENKDVVVEFSYKAILFLSGKDFMNWMDMSKRDMNNVMKDGEIKQ